MTEFSFAPMDVVAEFHGYRRARVIDKIATVEGGDVADKVRELVKKNGHRFDNHITFTTRRGGRFMWSDGKLIIGAAIEVGSW